MIDTAATAAVSARKIQGPKPSFITPPPGLAQPPEDPIPLRDRHREQCDPKQSCQLPGFCGLLIKQDFGAPGEITRGKKIRKFQRRAQTGRGKALALPG
jgi:hypothetical protein